MKGKHVCIAVLLLPAWLVAQSDQGGPDGFGYYWESSQDPGDSTRFSWLDPSGHAPVTNWTPNSDDGWAAVDLPYRFPFYGETLSSINVCTNGFLQFPSTLTSHLNSPLPAVSFPFMLAPFWDDLSPAQSGAVRRYDDPGAGFTAVTWHDVVRFNTAETLCCQALLFRDGRIRFNYLRTPAASNSSTVGIQGMSGGNGWFLQYVCNGRPETRVPADSTSVVFFVRRLEHDVGVAAAVCPVGWVPATGQAPVVALFKNFGLNTETFPVRALLIHSRFPFDTVFDRSATVTGLGPADTASCYFGDFIIGPSPDSWDVVFGTGLAGDMYGRNDTCRAGTSSFAPLFGTRLDAWEFPELGDGMNLCGITFRPDSNRFYVALNDSNRVLSFPASGPLDSLRAEQFQLQCFFADDLLWGIAWDGTEPGFWVTHVAASGPGCILARYRPDGTFAGDTWDLGSIEPGAWFAGLDVDNDGSLWATEVGGHNRLYRLAPRSRSVQGFLPGPTASFRACAFLGDSSCFLLSGGWNDHNLVRLDRTGAARQSVPLPDLADLDVYRPSSPRPESLVWAFATRSEPSNTIEQICLGRTWSGVGIRDEARLPAREPGLTAAPNPARGRVVRIGCPRAPGRLSLFDAAGRLVSAQDVSGPVRLSLRDPGGRPLPAGVYLLRLTTAGPGHTLKLVLLPD